MKTRVELLEKRKPTNTWASWEADTFKQVEMKENIKKEYFRRTRMLLQTKLYSRNLIQGRNTRAVSIVRYSGQFFKLARELKEMYQRTKKLMTMHKSLHPRDNIDRIYVWKKKEERGLTRIEDNVDTSKKWLADYIEKHEGGLFTGTRNDTDNTKNKRMKITRKQ